MTSYDKRKDNHFRSFYNLVNGEILALCIITVVFTTEQRVQIEIL